MLTPFIAERLCELAECTLCRSVCGHSQTALEGEQGAEVNDFALALWDHVLAGSLGEQPYGFEVDGDDLECY
jgi:hypothetical protein